MMPYLASLLCAFVLLGTASRSEAHAFLDHAEPAVGSRLQSSPGEVRIWFTQKLEPALSRIEVFDANELEVDTRDSHIDRSNPALLDVSLLRLKPGKYKVVWRAVSVDTHVTTGNFTFEVTP
jgi:copper resistance protein C